MSQVRTELSRLAAHGQGRVHVDERAVRRRIGRRRAARRAAPVLASAAVVVVAVVVATGGPGRLLMAGDSGEVRMLEDWFSVTCGEELPATVATPDGLHLRASELAITPAHESEGDDISSIAPARVYGVSMDVQNAGEDEIVGAFYGGIPPLVVLVDDGVVIAHLGTDIPTIGLPPEVVRWAPGETRTFAVPGQIQPCDGDVPPGEYEWFAMHRLVLGAVAPDHEGAWVGDRTIAFVVGPEPITVDG